MKKSIASFGSRSPASSRGKSGLRDLRIMPIGGGTSEVQKDIIGRLLGL